MQFPSAMFGVPALGGYATPLDRVKRGTPNETGIPTVQILPAKF